MILSTHEVGDVVKTQVPTLPRYEEHEPGLRYLRVDRQQPATREMRDAILSSLYDERKDLSRAKRLGKASPNEESYLNDLNAYIDQWEAEEARTGQADDDVWERLESLASAALSLLPGKNAK